MNLAKSLHNLGDIAFRNPWKFITGWVVVLAVLGFAALQFMEPTSSSLSIPGTAAQKAIDRAGELFPSSGGGTGRVVFHAKSDAKIADLETKITKVTTDISKLDKVTQAVSPFADESFVSKDGTIAYSQVQLVAQTGNVENSTIEAVQKIIEANRSDDLQIEIGGDLVQNLPGEIIGVGEIVGVIVALGVLVVTFGSLLSAGMPIISALIAIGVSTAGLFTLSRVIEINSTTPVLGIMLGLAVGIDYALFIINKHRNYALQGYGYQQAAGRALGTAGNAVVFAAITVIIALAALTVVQIPFMTTMGLAGASSIAVAALASVSLIPALLGLIGPRVFGRKLREKAKKAQKKGVRKYEKENSTTMWHKWGEQITSRPIPVLLVSIVIIGAIAWPAASLDLGLPTEQYAAKETSERKAYDLLTEGFGPGFNGPLIVVAESLPKVGRVEEEAVRNMAVEQFNQEVAEQTKQQQIKFQQQLDQAETVEQQMMLQQAAVKMQAEGEKQQQVALAKIDETVQEYAKFVQLKEVADKIAKLDNVAQVTPAMVRGDGTAGIIQVVSKTAPSSGETKNLIINLRDQQTQQKLSESGDVKLGVTGATALQEDVNEKLAAALPVYLAVVVGLSFVLLVIAFRSILVPIKATLGFLLSVLAMFGAIVAVFQWGWLGLTDAPGPIVSFVPIIATGILFGLAMDYEFFLVSSMHESYQRTKNAKQSVINGFGAGSKVVTAAAVIMISVFAGFITNHETVIQSIGFGLAVGILVDAFIVRMTIVPAIMMLLGKHAWWLPTWLDKWLPHVSIEGEDDVKS